LVLFPFCFSTVLQVQIFDLFTTFDFPDIVIYFSFVFFSREAAGVPYWIKVSESRRKAIPLDQPKREAHHSIFLKDPLLQLHKQATRCFKLKIGIYVEVAQLDTKIEFYVKDQYNVSFRWCVLSTHFPNKKCMTTKILHV
jgi:hypothetical protein